MKSNSSNTVKKELPPQNNSETQSLVNNYAIEGPPLSAPKQRCLFGIILSEDTTVINLFSYLLSVFFSIAFIVFLNMAQPLVLTEVLKLKHNLGDITGRLGLYDEIVSLFIVLLSGFISDFVGRKYVYFLGFVTVSISFIFYTLPSSLYPGLLLMRLLFSIGASICTSLITAGLGDMVNKKNGILSGLAGTFSGLGAISAIWSVLLLFTYKNTSTNKERICTMRHFNKENVKQYGKALKQLGTRSIKNININLGIISGFVARGDTVVITSYITLWALKFYQQKDLCETGIGLRDKFGIKKECRQAYTLAMKLSGIAQTLTIVGAIISGVLIHKLGPRVVLLVSSIIAFVGYYGFSYSFHNADKPIVMIWMALIGLGEAATIVTSLSLLSTEDNVDKNSFGKISGIYSFFGCIGVMVSTRLGGYLFDVWHPGAPFEMMGIFHVAIFVITLLAMIYKKLEKRDT